MHTATLTATMWAAVYRRFGPPDVVRLEELPKPTPRPDEVLIRVHASTVSAADYRARTRDVPRGLGLLVRAALGVFRPRRRVLGMDVAGVVESVGANVTRFRAGDEVLAMLGARFGGHAEYVSVKESGPISAKPASLSFEDAVTLVFGGLTANDFLARTSIEPGDRVLVNGASGAVGTAAVQLAKHLGAHVTGVCSAGNAQLVTSLGADRVIDYAATDFAAEGATYDVIVDCVGNAGFARVEGCLATGGALLLVTSDLAGMAGAGAATRRSGKLVTTGNINPTADDLAYLAGLADAGLYRAVIDRTFDFSDIAEAHRHVESGHKRGNVVVRFPAY